MDLQPNPVNPTEGEVSYFLDKHYQETMFAQFNSMRKKELMCDVFLRVKCSRERHGAHKLILASACAYFQNDTRSEDGEKEFFLPEETQTDALKDVLEYLYSGKLVVNVANVKPILQVAIFLKISKIQKFCGEFIMNYVTTNTALDFYRLACKFNLEELRLGLKKYILWNFSHIVSLKQYYTMSPEELEEIILSDDLRMKSEKHIYEAVSKWFFYDTLNRQYVLERLMKHVRFSLMGVVYLESFVVPQLVQTKKVTQIFAEENIIKFLYEEPQGQTKHLPRFYYDVTLIFSCKDNIIEIYDPVRERLEPKYNLLPGEDCGDSSEEHHHRAVRVKDCLYLVSERKVQMFDPMFLTWKDVGPGMDVRDSTICGDGESFYILGGKTCEKRAVRFDVETRSWKDLPNLLIPRRYPAVAKKLGKLYAIGGFSQGKPSKDVERYTGTKWLQVNSLNQERFQAQALVANSSLFTLGGRDLHGALDTIEVFAGRFKGWQSIKTSMLKRRTEFAAIAIDNKIWCFGGRGEQTIECFDVEKNISMYAGQMGTTYFDINAVTCPYI